MAKFIKIEGTTHMEYWVAPKERKIESLVLNEEDIVRVSSDGMGLATLLLKNPDKWGKPILFHSVSTYDSVVSALGDSIKCVEKVDLDNLPEYSPYGPGTLGTIK